MAVRTEKQKRQQELSWKLRMVMGARGNLYPREKSLSPRTQSILNSIYVSLKAAEECIRQELANIK